MALTKTILITGASSGIGLASATLLAQRGHRVIGTSRQPERVKVDGFELLPLDVCSDESVRACWEMVTQRVEQVDVLVNNAGHGMVGFLEETTVEDAKAIFETNFFGVVRMVNAALPHMRARRSGHIVNIGSLAGLVGVPSEGMYSATKFALEGYTETLRREVRRFNIRVSLIEPGDYDTPIFLPPASSVIDDYRRVHPRVIETRAHLMRTAPPPDEVAPRVAQVIERETTRLRHAVGREKWDVMWKRFLPEGLFEWFARRTFKLDED
jgi:NAD(P)-dependent dehydrogenase (short-subunit alcohol dehydrogenase family)